MVKIKSYVFVMCIALLLLDIAKGQSQKVNYVYDDLNRLIQVDTSDGVVVRYSYDASGNRTKLTVSGVAYKADVTPRPGGKRDGSITLNDWVQVGRFAIGLDAVINDSEFKRADCYPLKSYGDGKLDLFDWVQAGRYFAGLDDLVPAVAPIFQQPVQPGHQSPQSNVTRSHPDEDTTGQRSTINVENGILKRGDINELRVRVDDIGRINAMAFSINYDPRLLSFINATPSDGMGNAQLIILDNYSAEGRVGLGLALPPGQKVVAGSSAVLILRFRPLPGRGDVETKIEFGNLPTEPGVSDIYANPINAAFTGANIKITKDYNPSPIVDSTIPRSTIVGNEGIKLVVKGTHFVENSTLYWNDSARSTQFVSESELIAQISAADLLQIGTVSIKVKNPEPGGGASNAVSFAIENSLTLARSVRVRSVSASPGGKVNIPIELIAQGEENALSFSLSFDPIILTNPQLSLGGDAEVAQLIINDNQISEGRLGIAIAMPIGKGFPAGVRQVLNVKFVVAATTNANTVVLNVDDYPLQKAIASITASSLTTEWQSGEIEINRSLVSVSAATYDGSLLARDSIIAAFGSNLSTSIMAAVNMPLPTDLEGTTINITDSLGVEHKAPIFFVSPNQVNFLIPSTVSQGKGELVVTNKEGAISRGVVFIENVMPGLFSADSSGNGWASALVLRVRDDGTQIYEPIVDYDIAQGQIIPRPIDLSTVNDQVFLVLYGTGIRNRSSLSEARARVNSNDVQVLYAGGQPAFEGLDQVNIALPSSLAGKGEVDITLIVDGKIANKVKVKIK